ncbi:MAG: hypothetical protein O9296_05670 [Novosphingobium sp.]|nr:hypothetical protein [Novosphingobium sp.]
MTGRIWRMTAFDLKPNQTWPFSSAGHCVVFVPVGRAKIEGPDRATEIAAGEAVFLAGGDVVTSTEGAWIFELSADLVVAKHHSLVPVLSRRAQLPDGDLIIRADRIDQPAGLTTPSHHHRGPGIRRLVTGRLLAEVGDHIDLITTGQAWFESGLEPVVGTNLQRGTNTFVRVMVLPSELAGGKSSFVPTTPFDAARPRGVTPHVFGECPL